MSAAHGRDGRSQAAVVAALRSKGLTFDAIGQRLGVSRQYANRLVRKRYMTGMACAKCGVPINTATKPHGRNAPAICLACLADRPNVLFGQRLRSLRLAAGLPQEGLACAAGLTTGTVSLFERGQSLPAPRSLVKLARMLGTQIHASGAVREPASCNAP
jgi:transcriptional regulator with XRE-family HTH domain